MIKNENVEGEPAYDETYRRGPVVMRGPMIPKDNTYANLLAPEESTDWLHADPWRVLRIQAEFVDGFGALAELGPLLAASIMPGPPPVMTATPRCAILRPTVRAAL